MCMYFDAKRALASMCRIYSSLACDLYVLPGTFICGMSTSSVQFKVNHKHEEAPGTNPGLLLESAPMKKRVGSIGVYYCQLVSRLCCLRRHIRVEIVSFRQVLAQLASAVADHYVDDHRLLAILVFELLLDGGHEVVVKLLSHQVDGAAAEATTHDA